MDTQSSRSNPFSGLDIEDHVADHLHNTLVNSGYAAETITTRLQIIPWQLEDPDELFRAEISGSVRSGARLRQEGDAAIDRIRTAMSQDIMANYCVDGMPIIPTAAHIISVRKP